MTPHEALRQCVEAMKLVDFKDCAESEELWHKLNAAQQVAEEVLKAGEPFPYAYAYECVQPGTDGKGWAQFINRDPVMPKDGVRNIIPLYAAHIAAQQAEPAPTGDAEQDKLLAGQVVKWRKEVARLNDLIATATGQQAVAVPDWKEQLYAEMDAQFALRESAERDEDGQRVGMVIYDTQVGVEFAMDWFEKHVITAPQPAAAPSGDVERDVEHINKALRTAVTNITGPGFQLRLGDLDLVAVYDAAITATKE